MFLGYSSCHLGYCCLDLFSDRVYISRHVRFHEQFFPFLETAHVSAISNSDPQPAPSSHLPALTHFPSTKTPSALSKQVPLPPFAAMSIDYFAGSGSAAPDSTTPRSVAPSVVPSAASYGEQFGSPSWSSSSSQCPALSPPALDLCVDLSNYSLPQQPMPDRSTAPEVSRQHHMVLLP